MGNTASHTYIHWLEGHNPWLQSPVTAVSMVLTAVTTPWSPLGLTAVTTPWLPLGLKRLGSYPVELTTVCTTNWEQIEEWYNTNHFTDINFFICSNTPSSLPAMEQGSTFSTSWHARMTVLTSSVWFIPAHILAGFGDSCIFLADPRLYCTVAPLILGTGLYYTVPWSWNRTLLTPLSWEQDSTTP